MSKSLDTTDLVSSWQTSQEAKHILPPPHPEMALPIISDLLQARRIWVTYFGVQTLLLVDKKPQTPHSWSKATLSEAAEMS